MTTSINITDSIVPKPTIGEKPIFLTHKDIYDGFISLNSLGRNYFLLSRALAFGVNLVYCRKHNIETTKESGEQTISYGDVLLALKKLSVVGKAVSVCNGSLWMVFDELTVDDWS